MRIIDAQVHAYEHDHPGRPWVARLHGPDAMSGPDMIAAMDAVGVDGAILVSPWTMYRYDASYACEVYRAFPDRFRLVKPVDPAAPEVAETIAEWAGTAGAVGIRLMLAEDFAGPDSEAGVKRVLTAAGQHGLPVNILCWGRLERAEELAARHPDVRLVIDHLGLKQPFEPPKPDVPFADLPAVLSLARFDNVVIKITGACTLSLEPFPYADIWPPLERIFEAFGIERCLWGTDWTRAVAFLSYAQGVEPFRATERLSDDERALLMGANTQRVYGWQA